MQTMKQKRELRGFNRARTSIKTGDRVRLTYGQEGVITGAGSRPGTYLVQVGDARPTPYMASQFQRVP